MDITAMVCDMIREIIIVVANHAIEITFSALGIFFSTKLYPWIKANWNNWWVRIAVKAAEKLKESGKDIDKKAYVVEFLTKVGIKVDDVVDGMIESAVKELDILVDGIFSEINESAIEDCSK